MTALPDRVGRLLEDADRVFVVVAPGADPPRLTASDVVVVEHPGDPDHLHDLLVGRGQADVVLDVTRGKGVAHCVPVLAVAARRGGFVVVATPEAVESRRRLQTVLEDMAELRRDGLNPPLSPHTIHAIVVCATVTPSPRWSTRTG